MQNPVGIGLVVRGGNTNEGAQHRVERENRTADLRDIRPVPESGNGRVEGADGRDADQCAILEDVVDLVTHRLPFDELGGWLPP